MAEGESVDMSKLLERFYERLSEAGLKSTRQREVIFETFFSLNRHISVDELLAEVRTTAPHVGYATVYRTLKLLVEHGFARPRHFDDGQTRYDPQDEDEHEHDHLICIDCRRVMEFDDEVVHARLGQIVRDFGDYDLTRRKIELYARCRIQDCPHRPQ